MGALSLSSFECLHKRKSDCSGGKITAGLDSFGVFFSVGCRLSSYFANIKRKLSEYSQNGAANLDNEPLTLRN